MRMFSGLRCQSVWVASTCAASDAPMPKARVPNAPLVEVCESPHTIVMPGRVSPCSGATTCTIPWRGSSISNAVMPWPRVLRPNSSTTARASGSGMPMWRSLVGT